MMKKTKNLKKIEVKNAKFGNNPYILKNFNKKFDITKKEYERATREYLIHQENEKLKALDTVSIQKEIGKNKKILEDQVKSNKDLLNKIKEVKNKKDEIKEEDKKK